MREVNSSLETCLRKAELSVSYLRSVCKPYCSQCARGPTFIGEALGKLLKQEPLHFGLGHCGGARRPISSLVGAVGVCGLLADGQP